MEVNVVMPGFVRTEMSARFPGPKRFMILGAMGYGANSGSGS